MKKIQNHCTLLCRPEPLITRVVYRTGTGRFVGKIGYNSRQKTEELMKKHGGTGPWIYCFSMLQSKDDSGDGRGGGGGVKRTITKTRPGNT